MKKYYAPTVYVEESTGEIIPKENLKKLLFKRNGTEQHEIQNEFGQKIVYTTVRLGNVRKCPEQCRLFD